MLNFVNCVVSWSDFRCWSNCVNLAIVKFSPEFCDEYHM